LRLAAIASLHSRIGRELFLHELTKVRRKRYSGAVDMNETLSTFVAVLIEPTMAEARAVRGANGGSNASDDLASVQIDDVLGALELEKIDVLFALGANELEVEILKRASAYFARENVLPK
jgi:hypothetical protein